MNVDDIKRLRELTLQGISDCKKALIESDGDFHQALALLKKRGAEVLAEKKDRVTSQGLIEAYVHFGGNLGALVEVNCETDFVARTPVFKQFVKDLAMHIAATNPKYITKDDIPKDELDKINNLDEYIKENCLINQPFVKDSSKTIDDYLKEVITQTGENIVIRRFARFSL